jgi:hypothetical protein
LVPPGKMLAAMSVADTINAEGMVQAGASTTCETCADFTTAGIHPVGVIELVLVKVTVYVSAVAKVRTPVLLPFPEAAGDTPRLGETVQVTEPGVPPVALKEAVPPATMLTGAAGAITKSEGVSHWGVATTCEAATVWTPGVMHPVGMVLLVDVNVTV